MRRLGYPRGRRARRCPPVSRAAPIWVARVTSRRFATPSPSCRARERRARRRSRAGWTRPTRARGRENARRGRRSSRRTRPRLRRRPRAETRPARRLPHDPDLAPDSALGRDDASTRAPSGAPAPANARESPQPTPMCTQPPPPASHADDAEGDDVVAATPDADLGRSDDATKGGTSRSTSVGSKRRRPASATRAPADRRETRSTSARRRAERPHPPSSDPSPSLDASLDAPESAYRRLASPQLRGAYSLDESDEFAASKRAPRGTDTSDDDGSGRGPRRARRHPRRPSRDRL